MSVRRHKTDPNKWIIDYYPEARRGARHRIAVEGTEAELRRMHIGSRSRAVHSPINRILREYLEWHRLHRSAPTHQDLLCSLKYLQRLFGTLPISRIAQTGFDRCKQQRDRANPSTDQELAFVDEVRTWAQKQAPDGHFNAALTRYLPRLKATDPVRHKQITVWLSWLRPHFGPLQIDKINPGDYRKRRGHLPRTINKEIDYLQAIIAWKGRGKATPRPCPSALKIPYERSVPTAPHPDDVAAFMEEIRDPLKLALCSIMFEGGGRFTASIKIRWEHINWRQETVTMTATKRCKQSLDLHPGHHRPPENRCSQQKPLLHRAAKNGKKEMILACYKLNQQIRNS